MSCQESFNYVQIICILTNILERGLNNFSRDTLGSGQLTGITSRIFNSKDSIILLCSLQVSDIHGRREGVGEGELYSNNQAFFIINFQAANFIVLQLTNIFVDFPVKIGGFSKIVKFDIFPRENLLMLTGNKLSLAEVMSVQIRTIFISFLCLFSVIFTPPSTTKPGFEF